MTDSQSLPQTTAGSAELQGAEFFQELIMSTGTILDTSTLLRQLVIRIAERLACDQTIILVLDADNTALEFGAIHPQPTDEDIRRGLDDLHIALHHASDRPVLSAWLNGQVQPLTLENTADHPALKWLMSASSCERMWSVPLRDKSNLIGVLIAGHHDEAEDFAIKLEAAARAACIAVQNSRVYTKTVQQAETHMRELTILRQIDRELNDTIDPQHVFSMTLDWALRFTNAQAASLGLYDQETDELRIIAHYGYDSTEEQIALLRPQRGGIGHRVARSGYAEVIPDVSLDKDFVRGANLSVSQMSVPVMREDRVIAVINVESKKLNGFTDEHLDFVEKLATRAGVAIDNARLFDATVREREKLSLILNNTADVVIVFGIDERLILINPAAYSALRLHPSEEHIGLHIKEVLHGTALMETYQQAKTTNEPVVGEVELPNGRIFHINLSRHENVGWIAVMHDITMFKEMDQLKSELIATVSHDLKQPLAVMNGYLELLMMHGKMDETGNGFIDMVRRSVQSMRQLIDDLLDLAKIESGIHLNPEPVNIQELVTECMDALQPLATSKNMEVHSEMPANLPVLMADRSRLQQILMNLIGNAVKYTPPDGKVQVICEKRDQALRILVQDNGMGISPEDQSHIFERFYRVRRPETDSIEGTGLGLAIVKSLVEAHNGKISLESRLGEGTTFQVTLPAYDD